jgi:lipopolysaccharide exporter
MKPAITEQANSIAAHQQSIQRGRFAHAATLLSVSSLGLRLFALLTTSILARALVPSDYGIVALATAVTGFLDVVSNIQVAGSIIRAPEVTEDHLRSAFTINLLRGIFSALLMVIFAAQLAWLLGDARLAPVLRALALVPLLNGLQNPAFILFERQLQFMPDVKRTMLANLIGAATSICLALQTHSYWALVVSTVVIALVHTCVTYWRVPNRVGFSLSHFREMFGFGGWLALTSIVEYVNGKVDFLLIGRGIGAAPLGAYQAGGQIIATATGDVVGPLVRAIFPSLAMTRTPEELRDKYIRIQAVILSLALPIGIGLSAMAIEAVALLLGDRWAQAVPVVQLLGPLTALQTRLGDGRRDRHVDRSDSPPVSTNLQCFRGSRRIAASRLLLWRVHGHHLRARCLGNLLPRLWASSCRPFDWDPKPGRRSPGAGAV